MAATTTYSRKVLGVITMFVLVMSAGVNVGLYFGMERFFLYLTNNAGNERIAETLSWTVANEQTIRHYFYIGAVPVITVALLLTGLVLWFVLRGSLSKTLSEAYVKKEDLPAHRKSKKDFVDQKIEVDRKRRLFLHSLSVLQREGRLLDFFDEDLRLYEDEQIGAAVRSIQEDCKKTIKKYIDPVPVMEAEEGDNVKIEAGFDIDAIKLVGNVSGNPPFEGILKHRGWKAGKKEIPKLSDIQDAAIIIPAEVEIH